jgi:hypothetical protein
MPERPPIGKRLESEHLLHAAVAVGCNDEDNASRQAHDDIVVEFALLPVVKELVAAVPRSEVIEESSEDEVVGETLQIGLHLRGT